MNTIDKQKIVALLKDYDQQEVEKFASYIKFLSTEKDRKTGKPKNYWVGFKTNEELAELFRRVKKDGLPFDGVHVTLQSTGISYDYIAYKNKMLTIYPDSKVDVSLVYQGDVFNFTKISGAVEYQHAITNPFNQKDTDIIGGYCVIRNKRGESLTVLSKADIEKHRKVARTDMIWRQWPKEMALKTVIKKACKQHFADIYENMEESDNVNYDLDNPLGLDIKHKKEIDEINDVESLRVYYADNKGAGKEFDGYVAKRKAQLQSNPT